MLTGVLLGGCSAVPARPAPVSSVATRSPGPRDTPRDPVVPRPHRPAAAAAHTEAVPAVLAARVTALVERLGRAPTLAGRERALAALAEYGARAAPVLAQALPDADPAVQRALLELLALGRHPGAGADAAPHLGHADWRVREAAARVLRVAPVAAAREALALGCRDAVARVRVAAATALGALADPACTVPLDALARRATGRVRDAAIRALAVTPGPAAVAVLAALVAERPAAPDAAAVRALGRRLTPGYAAGVAALRAVVDTADAAVRRPALVGLARAGAPWGPERTRALAREVAAVVAGDTDPPLEGPDHVAALAAGGPRAVWALADAAAGATDAALVHCLLALERLPGAEATAALRQLATRADAPRLLWRVLGQRRDAASVPLLTARAAGDDEAAAEAVRALGRIGGDAAVQVLTDLLHAPGVGKRTVAAAALQEAAGAGAVVPLSAALASETDELVRAHLLRALGRADLAAGAAVARRLLDGDTAVSVREAAADVLGHVRGDGARQELVQAATTDTDPAVRQQSVVAALARGADPAALLPLLEDPADYVRALACRALAPSAPIRVLAVRTRPLPAEDAALRLGEPEADLRADAVAWCAARTILGDAGAEAVAAACADPEPAVRGAAAVSAAVALPAARAWALLRPLLEDPEETVRLEALRGLAALGDPAAVERAMALLRVEGTEPGVRRAAAEALVAAGDPRGAGVIRRRLEADPPLERPEREALLRALATFADPASLDRFVAEATALAVPPPEGGRRGFVTAHAARVRVAALRLCCWRAVGFMDDPRAEPALRAEAAQPERRRAVPALCALAERQWRLGRPDDALATIAEARALDPRDPEAFVAAARLAAARGRDGVAWTPDGPDPLAAAAAAIRVGDEPLAARVLDAALAHRPDPDVAAELQGLLWHLGRVADAGRLAAASGGPGPDPELPTPDALAARAIAALVAGDAAAARRAAGEALVRAADPLEVADRWPALVAQAAAAAGDPAGADRAWVAAARSALATRPLDWGDWDGRLFAAAAAAAVRLGEPGGDRFAALARRLTSAGSGN